ncbi:MAG: hypoxanthine phosphoribosyltransferase [Clostridia bacterium]|nr:hypoxanthine phosphoribosyltransferase [Oscillospiraceae bacterium]MBQ2746705.1 hypoxanthine phosphoribosyltransferase [Clostridia bacterium]
MDNDIKKVLLTKEEIEAICKRLGEQISRDYAGKKLLLVSVLKGAVVFMADIMRNITVDAEIDFMSISSYKGAESTGVVQFKKDLDINPDGYDILIVEDILDTGRSLRYIADILLRKNANSVKICTFLDKPENRKADISADYVGAKVPNEFVVGYGLDYNEKYRNLPYLGVLKPEVYSK